MKITRIALLPLLLAICLLFAQQAGAAHAIHHTLEDLARQQKNHHALHSDNCQKCADYAQLGNALNAGTIDFTPPAAPEKTLKHYTAAFRSIRILAATARAPPYSA